MGPVRLVGINPPHSNKLGPSYSCLTRWYTPVYMPVRRKYTMSTRPAFSDFAYSTSLELVSLLYDSSRHRAQGSIVPNGPQGYFQGRRRLGDRPKEASHLGGVVAVARERPARKLEGESMRRTASSRAPSRRAAQLSLPHGRVPRCADEERRQKVSRFGPAAPKAAPTPPRHPESFAQAHTHRCLECRHWAQVVANEVFVPGASGPASRRALGYAVRAQRMPACGKRSELRNV